MATVKYEVVEHDGGWAYKVGDVFSEPFFSHSEALAAADTAAAHHQAPGADETIEYQDALGRWHEEDVSGHDRPETEVLDRLQPHPGTAVQRTEKRPVALGGLTVATAVAAAAGFIFGYLIRSSRRG